MRIDQDTTDFDEGFPRGIGRIGGDYIRGGVLLVMVIR